MSKRYSGKSFKDSSAAKKPKLSLKEKRKNKKEKSKKSQTLVFFLAMFFEGEAFRSITSAFKFLLSIKTRAFFFSTR